MWRIISYSVVGAHSIHRTCSVVIRPPYIEWPIKHGHDVLLPRCRLTSVSWQLQRANERLLDPILVFHALVLRRESLVCLRIDRSYVFCVKSATNKVSRCVSDTPAIAPPSISVTFQPWSILRLQVGLTGHEEIERRVWLHLRPLGGHHIAFGQPGILARALAVEVGVIDLRVCGWRRGCPRGG